MKFFTFQEVIISIISALILGIIFGCIYSASGILFYSLRKLISSVSAVYRNIDAFSKETVKKILSHKSFSKLSRLGENLCDAAVFLFFGISSLVLVYLTLDGVFRAYVFAVLIFAFVISVKTLGKSFCVLFDYIFRYLFKLVIYIEYLFLYPVNFIIKSLKTIIIKICAPIGKRIDEIKFRNTTNRKIMEIKKILD